MVEEQRNIYWLKLRGRYITALSTDEPILERAFGSAIADFKMNRANEYATPTHSARTTKAYSVSFPVWIVRSQLSNSSTSGQTRQVIKTSVIIVRDTQDRIPSSIAQRFPRAVSKSY